MNYRLSKRKQMIYDTALNLFVLKGYDGTSMSEIALHVGIQKATLYSHFKGKEEIFKLILDSIINEHTEDVLKLVDIKGQKSVIEKLQRIFLQYIQLCQDNQKVDFWTRFYYFPPAGLKETIHAKTHGFESIFKDRLLDLIKQGIKSGDIKGEKASDIMNAFYYLLLGFIMSFSEYTTKEIKKTAVASLDIFLRGILV